jgi:energy-coupling factor transporter ATP-binding protein EcfA2
MEINMTAIEIKDLQFKYSDNHVALCGVTLRIEEGENVGLIGPNGAGKSTLLMHLNGILPETLNKQSAISIFGLTVNESNLLTIRRNVGLLFQDADNQLFCPTVYEDVAFGPAQFGKSKMEVETLVEEALTKVGLQGYENRSPHHLSGGEKQRVCLAGVLACEPKVLALDEPTRDLDPRGKRHLKTILSSIKSTKIIATHDLELVVELCNRTIILDEGKVVADGPTITLLSDEEFMLSHGLEKPHILKHIHPH